MYDKSNYPRTCMYTCIYNYPYFIHLNFSPQNLKRNKTNFSHELTQSSLLAILYNLFNHWLLYYIRILILLGVTSLRSRLTGGFYSWITGGIFISMMSSVLILLPKIPTVLIFLQILSFLPFEMAGWPTILWDGLPLDVPQPFL